MKQEIELICNCAENKKEAIEFIKKQYDGSAMEEALEIFEKAWKGRKDSKSTMSFRGLNLRRDLAVRALSMFELAKAQDKNLYLWLVSEQKKVPAATYRFLMSETSPKREFLRGKKVMVVDILNNNIWCKLNEEVFKFSILDINKSKLAEIR